MYEWLNLGLCYIFIKILPYNVCCYGLTHLVQSIPFLYQRGLRRVTFIVIPQSAVQTSSSFVLALSSSFSGPAGAISPAGGGSGGYSAHAGDGAAHSSTNNNIETWHAGYFTYRASLQAC